MTPTGKPSRTAARSRHDERPTPSTNTRRPRRRFPTCARALAARLAGAVRDRPARSSSALNDAHHLLAAAPTTGCATRSRGGPARDPLTRSIARSGPTSKRPSSAASSPSTSASSPSSSPTRSPPPAISRRSGPLSERPRARGRHLATGQTKGETNDERPGEDPGAGSAGGGARPRAAPPRDPQPASAPWRPKRPASSRPRSRTSPRCWKPKSTNAPSDANDDD